MGLLDDAIREHLELKRQRGADPTEVARQERAALAPPHDDDLEAGESDLDSDAEPAYSGDRDEGEAYDAEGPGRSNGLQETAEIDMRTVLADLDAGGGAPWSDADAQQGAARTIPARGEHD